MVVVSRKGEPEESSKGTERKRKKEKTAQQTYTTLKTFCTERNDEILYRMKNIRKCFRN